MQKLSEIAAALLSIKSSRTLTTAQFKQVLYDILNQPEEEPVTESLLIDVAKEFASTKQGRTRELYDWTIYNLIDYECENVTLEKLT